MVSGEHARFCSKNPHSVLSRPPAFTALIKLFNERYALLTKQTSEEAEVGLTNIDVEEQMAGYQVAYSRLAASDIPEPDPVAYVNDVKQYLSQELVKASKAGAQVQECLKACDYGVIASFLQDMATAGYAL